MKEIDYIKTSDVDLATSLYTMGIPIDGIYATNEITYLREPKMEFYFLDSPETKEAISDYYQRNLRLDPYMLFSNRKEIITRMKDEQRNVQ